MDGLTSNVQTQLTSLNSTKAGISGGNTYTGEQTYSNQVRFNNNVIVNGATISTIEFGYLDGLTSSIQNQITNITTNNSTLAGNKTFSGTILFNSSINNVSNATFDFLKNITSDVQTQINSLSTGSTSYLSSNNHFTGINYFDNDNI